MLSSATLLAVQNPEYDFYPEFRNSFTPKLREEGVRETEITRRVTLLLTKRNALEADYWNRYYLDSKSNLIAPQTIF
jgi:hypothetical protein